MAAGTVRPRRLAKVATVSTTPPTREAASPPPTPLPQNRLIPPHSARKTSLSRQPGRVEEGRGGGFRRLRFPSPLIKPDVRISRIRLSDWLHCEAHGGGARWTRRRWNTPCASNTAPRGKRRVPCEGTL